MDVVNITAYAYKYGVQYPVQIPLIRSSALIEYVKTHGPSTFERTYTGLHEGALDSIVRTNFDGYDLWAAVRACPQYYMYYPSEGSAGLSDFIKLYNLLGLYVKRLDAPAEETPPSSSYDFIKLDRIVSVLGEDYYDFQGSNWNFSVGRLLYSGSTWMIVNRMNTSSFMTMHSRIYSTSTAKYLYVGVIPDDYFINGRVNPAYANDTDHLLYIQIEVHTDNNYDEINAVVFSDVDIYGLGSYNTFFGDRYTPDYAQNVADPENPYGEPGTSNVGGGDGSYGDPDEVDPTAVPDLPTISASSTGFITIYNPSSANLSALGSFLWSNMFDINTFKKLYADPMDCIISLGIVPCLPNSAGTQNIKFGNVDTGINCSVLSTQYAKVDCGSVNITKYVGSFMDYSPYVKVSLFLPYIGFIHLGTDDIMGGSINVTYHVDVLSGDCIAFITHSSKGVLYSYTGNCLTNVPVTAANYANSLRNYYEAVTGIIPSTANGAMSGGAAGAAAGAIGGALTAASNIVLNTKPDFQRSGSLGGSSGIMGVQKPFIIIERPNISVPNNVQNYMGQTSNITANLGGLSGYTIVEACHIENVPCTTEELSEIEALLKGGVIL